MSSTISRPSMASSSTAISTATSAWSGSDRVVACRLRRIVPRRWEPHVGMKMLTLGCSEGNDPTAWKTRITNPRYRGLSGNPEYEAIECQTAPKQGRTGGGLFTVDDYLAGVCNFAEPQGDHGLYAAPDSIYRLLDRNHLTFLYAAPVVTEEQIDDLFRAAERQLEEDDWEGANRTIQRLDALIEERRKDCKTRSDRSMPSTHDELSRSVVRTRGGPRLTGMRSPKKASPSPSSNSAPMKRNDLRFVSPRWIGKRGGTNNAADGWAAGG